MKIYYGTENKCIDVTDICNSTLLKDNIITIEKGDQTRSYYFTDPCQDILKKIYIVDGNNIQEYDHHCIIEINILNNQIKATSNVNNTIDIYNNTVKYIHNELQLKHGNLIDELPEQCLVVKYLTGYEKVLELGSNIGRNSLVISYILRTKNNNDFVTLESDSDTAKLLIENRDINNFNFHIDPSALSKKNLIQKGWSTIESDVLLEGYKNVNTITLEQLYSKYNIIFDTLVLDCEGAFYYILKDMPEILDNIKLIIMENDYPTIENKNYVDDVLRQNNFYIHYVEEGGWGCCYNNFYEVWKKQA